MFDTSVLVAAQLKLHINHVTAWVWLDAAQKGTIKMLVAAHSMAECYSTLTRLPKPARIRPGVAAEMIEKNIAPFAAITALVPDEYLTVIQQLARESLGGGMVYDAMGVKAAQSAQADRLLTFNLKHFRRLWPQGQDKIISPRDVAPSGFVPPPSPT